MTNYFDVSNSLFQPLQSLGFTIMAATALPALSLVITTTFIVSLTNFLTQKVD